MARAKLLPEGVFCSAKSNRVGTPVKSRARHVAHAKPNLPPPLSGSFKRQPSVNICDQVVIGDRPQPSIARPKILKYVVNPARYPGHLGSSYESLLLHLRKNVLQTGDKTMQFDSPQETMEGNIHVSSNIKTSFTTIHSIKYRCPAVLAFNPTSRIASASTLFPGTSKQIDLVEGTPTVSSRLHPTPDEDNQSPSPAQLSFILLGLRDEVIDSIM